MIFYMQINKPFYKLILSILVNMASLAQSTRNNKFAKSLQYLEKEVRDKVDFCRDKLQSIQKVGTVISDGMPKVLRITTAISSQCLKKVASIEADFLHADKHLNFLQVDTTFFTVFMCLARPVSSTQKNL